MTPLPSSPLLPSPLDLFILHSCHSEGINHSAYAPSIDCPPSLLPLHSCFMCVRVHGDSYIMPEWYFFPCAVSHSDGFSSQLQIKFILFFAWLLIRRFYNRLTATWSSVYCLYHSLQVGLIYILTTGIASLTRASVTAWRGSMYSFVL